jgi:hypothetical protein
MKSPRSGQHTGNAKPSSVLVYQTSKRYQIPRRIRRRRSLPQNIEIAVIGAQFEKDLLRPEPLVEHLVNHVLAVIDAKTNWSLVCLSSRVAIDFQFHSLLFSQIGKKASDASGSGLS